MDQTTYLFIDGSYAQRIFREAMQAVFGEADAFDVAKVTREARAFRTYYYDCPDDLKKPAEAEAHFEARKSAQDEFFAKVRTLRGVHLRLGTLKGQRRREQKEIDVLLAVDMLEHGLNRNMTHAVLVAGDLDFRPVVEALVRNGVFVEIWCEKSSAASELPWAADFGRELRWPDLWNWANDSFSAAHTVPSNADFREPIYRENLLKEGKLNDCDVIVMRRPSTGSTVLQYKRSSGLVTFEHRDVGILTRYFEMLYGSVDWRSD